MWYYDAINQNYALSHKLCVLCEIMQSHKIIVPAAILLAVYDVKKFKHHMINASAILLDEWMYNIYTKFWKIEGGLW